MKTAPAPSTGVSTTTVGPEMVIALARQIPSLEADAVVRLLTSSILTPQRSARVR